MGKQPELWAYFDCFAGVSGDMTLGALIDLGLDVRELREVLSLTAQTDIELTTRRLEKNHLTGVKVEFASDFPQPTRSYAEICALLNQAPVSDGVRQRSLKMFRMLGEVEARIHGQPLEQVHFHELGGLDTILDVVGAAWGVEKLGITRVFCSSLPMGWGMIASAHGRLPNPAPATMELLKGLPLYGTDLPGELVTPTGAVILKGLEARYEPCPAMRLTQVGYGAGSRDLPGHPNLLRIYLGEPLAAAPGLRETVSVLETHIDDMNPELYEPLMAGLFAAGALDVALAPIQMKKNRPGVRLTVIAPPAARESLLERLFLDSTTLGVRVMEVERVAARRWPETVDTPYGPLEVKVMEYGGQRRVMPEYEACRRLAEERGISLLEVYRFINPQIPQINTD
ncbi:MAG: nickel pincer cofactor biosynthesis protein LarC [Deltaproteobacteria bacterium]|nr:nickel pincer cofactor biosynthesis protein LarC [Deltaproteobacteria bacterium]